MPVIKEYTIKIKWEHDKGSKAQAIADIEKGFTKLHGTIRQVNKEIGIFNKARISSKILGPASQSKLSPIPSGLYADVRYQLHKERIFGHLGLLNRARVHFRAGRGARGLSVLSEAMGEGAGMLGAGAEMLAPILGPLGLIIAGLGIIGKATEKISKQVEQYGQMMAVARSQAVLSGWTGLGPQMQNFQKRLGVSLSPFSGWAQLSYESHFNPLASQEIMRRINQMRIAGGPAGQQIASYIQSHVYDKMSSLDVLRFFARQNLSTRAGIMELESMGASPDEASKLMQAYPQVKEQIAHPIRINTKAMVQASNQLNYAWSQLYTTIEKQVQPVMVSFANSLTKIVKFLEVIINSKVFKYLMEGTADYVNWYGNTLGTELKTVRHPISMVGKWDNLLFRKEGEGLNYLSHLFGGPQIGANPSNNAQNTNHSDSINSPMRHSNAILYGGR